MHSGLSGSTKGNLGDGSLPSIISCYLVFAALRTCLKISQREISHWGLTPLRNSSTKKPPEGVLKIFYPAYLLSYILLIVLVILEILIILVIHQLNPTLSIIWKNQRGENRPQPLNFKPNLQILQKIWKIGAATQVMPAVRVYLQLHLFAFDHCSCFLHTLWAHRFIPL